MAISFEEAFENVDFDIDESTGEMNVFNPNKLTAPEEGDEPEGDEPETDEGEPETDEGEPEGDEPDGNDEPEHQQSDSARERLEQQLADARERLARLEGANLKPADKKREVEDVVDAIIKEYGGDEEFDILQELQSPKGGVKFLKSVVERVLEPTLSNVQELQEDLRVRQELTDVYQKYPDFGAHVGTIHEILTEYPELTFEQAYKVSKKMVGGAEDRGEAGKATTANKKKAKSKQRKVISAAELRKQTAKLQTEQGVGATPGKAQRAKTVADAVAQSLDELGL